MILRKWTANKGHYSASVSFHPIRKEYILVAPYPELERKVYKTKAAALNRLRKYGKVTLHTKEVG